MCGEGGWLGRGVEGGRCGCAGVSSQSVGGGGLAANNFEGNARLLKGCPSVHCCRFTVMRFIRCVAAAVQGQTAHSHVYTVGYWPGAESADLSYLP